MHSGCRFEQDTSKIGPFLHPAVCLFEVPLASTVSSLLFLLRNLSTQEAAG